jgi:ribulose-phosphate 3-epimerase
MTVRIAPSILAADFARLADAVALVEAGGADLLHVDVMDGHFVPNITLGPPVVAALKRVTKLPLDVHLMIEEPDRYLDAFAQAGADMISVHAEVLPHLHRTLSRIRALGAKAGVAINPSTSVSVIADVLDRIDFVLVMSVNPGFSGQTFIPHSIPKIVQARELLNQAGSAAAIEVDGGAECSNIASLVSAGASIVVAGAAVFGQPDPAAAVRALREAAGPAR